MSLRSQIAVPALAASLVFGGAFALTSCKSDSASPPATAAPAALTSIPTIADLQKQLEGKSITCKLEYEGLRQDDKTLSICVIDNEQATLTIWDKPDVLKRFLDSDIGSKGATAVGANWTIDVDSAATAQKIATALGGTVKASTVTSSSR